MTHAPQAVVHVAAGLEAHLVFCGSESVRTATGCSRAWLDGGMDDAYAESGSARVAPRELCRQART